MFRIKDYKDGNVEPKKHWHPYTLQSLNCEKFARIVNKILNGEHILVELDRSVKLYSQD
jgi:hypothetical protein